LRTVVPPPADENAADVGAFGLEESLRHGDGVGHAVGGNPIIADDDLFVGQRAPRQACDEGDSSQTQEDIKPSGHALLRFCFSTAFAVFALAVYATRRCSR
jgi:hypothetical protein